MENTDNEFLEYYYIYAYIWTQKWHKIIFQSAKFQALIEIGFNYI